LQNGGVAPCTASFLTALGIKHARCAIRNSDAMSAYAKQLAIKLLLKKIYPQETHEREQEQV
jgi:hypothetical protein